VSLTSHQCTVNLLLINELFLKLIQIVFSLLVSGCYDVLEEKDELSSDEEGGMHDDKRGVTLSQVNTFIMYILVENRMSICEITIV